MNYTINMKMAEHPEVTDAFLSLGAHGILRLLRSYPSYVSRTGLKADDWDNEIVLEKLDEDQAFAVEISKELDEVVVAFIEKVLQRPCPSLSRIVEVLEQDRTVYQKEIDCGEMIPDFIDHQLIYYAEAIRILDVGDSLTATQLVCGTLDWDRLWEKSVEEVA